MELLGETYGAEEVVMQPTAKRRRTEIVDEEEEEDDDGEDELNFLDEIEYIREEKKEEEEEEEEKKKEQDVKLATTAVIPVEAPPPAPAQLSATERAQQRAWAKRREQLLQEELEPESGPVELDVGAYLKSDHGVDNRPMPVRISGLVRRKGQLSALADDTANNMAALEAKIKQGKRTRNVVRNKYGG